uniref:Golgi apparatus membrane protein TVP23 homolog n=1 Tax=Schistosoma japonicum TaxID=6182 RepID=C1L4B7_SCHJA|nr:FAM18-like protein CG5021 [Schistosoma japonicum]
MMDSRDEVVLALTDNMDTEPSSSGFHSSSTRRLAVIGHYFFRSSALIIYLLCAWFTTSFVLPFIFILVCLSLDFWVVKNISGRILVGLRWSSYTDEAGRVHWRYDARKPSPIDSADVSSLSRRELAARIVRQQLSRLFWIGLIASPALWCVFFLAAIFFTTYSLGFCL